MFLTLLAILLGPVLLTTLLASSLFRLLGRTIGSSISSKTAHRREILAARAAEEEKEASTTTSSSSSSSISSEDWERIETSTKKPIATEEYSGIIGFFHPFCNAGGGGERVLFQAILATQQKYPQALCVVYTGDHDASKEQILDNARNRFNINIRPARVAFLYLTTRDYVLASRWPRFTLLGQSLGSLVLGWEALNMLPPDVLVDTMGYAFVLGLSKWLFPKTPTGAYVHYPTISTDMLSSLQDQTTSQGLNAGGGAGLRGKAKQFYWEHFAKLYSKIGGSVDVVMTNSTWTQRHISSLWKAARTAQGKKYPITVVYPPCAVKELQEKIPLDRENSQARRNVLYIAQFRPEKMHSLIIESFHAFLREHHSETKLADRPKLILVGSVRDDHDEKRVYALRLQAQEVKESVEFIVNAKWPQILDHLRTSSVGVNGMWNEHFGIGVVEYQAAGLVSVVNDSGGPKEDIVVEVEGGATGFHARDLEGFKEGYAKALGLEEGERYRMRERARKSAWRFSEGVFEERWIGEMGKLVGLCGT